MKDHAEVSIDFETFVLPFMVEESSNVVETSGENQSGQDEKDEEDEYSRDDALDAMQQRIPREAIELGETDGEVDNWTSWEMEDHYYLLPWDGEQFDWALIRITWDDNWGRYGWESCARISGVSDSKVASRLLVEKLFDRWGIDLGDSDNDSYRDFLDRI